MILTCPQCATRYQTDPALFPSDGRKVRCAKCGHAWHQGSPESEPELGVSGAQIQPGSRLPEGSAAGNADDDETPAASIRGSSVHRSGERIAALLGWLGVVGILGFILWSAVTYREAIASAWPASSSFYKAIGLPVDASDLAVTDVKSHREVVNGQLVLVVSGNLVNIADRALPVPALRVTLFDSDDHQLEHWDFSAEKKLLKPGDRIGFTTQHANPPATTHNFKVTFVEAVR
jgi:predicted Zn finger-like uncharacterized protein